jgi:hypothetical protein
MGGFVPQKGDFTSKKGELYAQKQKKAGPALGSWPRSAIPVTGTEWWGRDRVSQLVRDDFYRFAVVVGDVAPPSDTQPAESCASRFT